MRSGATMTSRNSNRRDFLARAAQGTAFVVTGGLGWFYLLNEQSQAAADRFRPPGAESETDFYAKCIKCGQCVVACPFDTLSLAPSGANVPVGTPHFSPQNIPCYMCEDIPCQEACPTGAISPDLESIDEARMGLATIDIENCLSWKGLRCEICYRECPIKEDAISVIEQPRRISRHAMFVPVVHSDACTGCGICEKACPTEMAAIRVVQPELVLGKIGEHYRLGWENDARITQDFRPASSEGSTAAETEDKTGNALDYLNEAGSL